MPVVRSEMAQLRGGDATCPCPCMGGAGIQEAKRKRELTRRGSAIAGRPGVQNGSRCLESVMTRREGRLRERATEMRGLWWKECGGGEKQEQGDLSTRAESGQRKWDIWGNLSVAASKYNAVHQRQPGPPRGQPGRVQIRTDAENTTRTDLSLVRECRWF